MQQDKPIGKKVKKSNNLDKTEQQIWKSRLIKPQESQLLVILINTVLGNTLGNTFKFWKACVKI